jgi:multicomponent Na+:H+ antiporter subunit G
VNVVGEVFILLGSALTMIGGIGAVRFPDIYSRMHAAAKAPTLGLVLVAIGAACTIRTSLAICALVLVVVLQLLSAPLGSHAISRATHRHRHRDRGVDLDAIDDLARDRPN